MTTDTTLAPNTDDVLILPTLPPWMTAARKHFQEIARAEIQEYERTHPAEPETQRADDRER